MSEREAEREARDIKAKAPFPDLEAKGLAALVMKVGKQFGLCLTRQREFITNDGRFAVEMALAGAKWIDNNTGRLLMTGKPPREAVSAICKLAQSVPEWEIGSPNDLVFRAKRQVSALKGVGQLRPQDLKALGLTQSPANDVLQTLIAAARLLASGALGTPAGKRDQALIVEAANGADPAVAKRLRDAVTTCKQIRNRLANLAIESDDFMKEVLAASEDFERRSDEIGVLADAKLKEGQAKLAAAGGLVVTLQFPEAAITALEGILALEEANDLTTKDEKSSVFKARLDANRQALRRTEDEINFLLKRQKQLGCP